MPLRVARHGHEVERDVAVHVPREIGQEHEGALEDGDNVQAVGIVARGFPAPSRATRCLNLLRRRAGLSGGRRFGHRASIIHE